MDKIVVTTTEGDGCSWSAETVQCLEYESMEAFYCELEAAVKQYQRERAVGYGSDECIIGGVKFSLDNYIIRRLEPHWMGGHTAVDSQIDMPEIMLLDEWFISKYNEELICGARK